MFDETPQRVQYNCSTSSECLKEQFEHPPAHHLGAKLIHISPLYVSVFRFTITSSHQIVVFDEAPLKTSFNFNFEQSEPAPALYSTSTSISFEYHACSHYDGRWQNSDYNVIGFRDPNWVSVFQLLFPPQP